MTEQMRWRIWIADLNPVEGSEQGGTRPVMVVSDEDFNRIMPVLTVLPLTTLKPGRKIYPSEVLIKKGKANLDADSLVLAHQIRTISKGRLRKDIGFLKEPGLQQQVVTAIKEHLDLP